MRTTKETNTKNKIPKANKGITLIALVITIIVMLILVAVTISMAVNGGLFDYAGKAVDETQAAIDAEQQLADGKVQVDGKWYASIDDYIKGIEMEEHNWSREGDTFTCNICNATYTMGQVLNYTPAGKNSTTITAEKSGMDDDQTIEVQSTKWVVLGIEDTNNNGTDDALLITTINPVGATSEKELYFNGAAAYNNGPDEINRVCEELYSNNEYGLARGMTIEDVNSTLNFNPYGGVYRKDYTAVYYTTGNLTTKLKELSIWEDLTSRGTYTPDGLNTEIVLGEYTLNKYWYDVSSDLTLANVVNDTKSTITEIEKNVIFGGLSNYSYHLASRGISAEAGLVYFGMGHVNDIGIVSSGEWYYTSNDGEDERKYDFRPVVSLKYDIPEKSLEVINWEDYDEEGEDVEE